MRIVIVGVTGSGKTTLARAVSARTGVPHVEMDALHWEPNWRMADLDVFRARISAALSGKDWVVEGNYSKARDLVWPRADQLVWLDYPLSLVMAWLVRRTARRVFKRELLWGTNRERLRDHLLSKDSLFSGRSRPIRATADYPKLLARPEHAHLQVIRLRTPREARAWLRSLTPVV